MKLLRPYFAVVLILLVMAPLLFKAGFIVYFTLNKTEIVEQHCVNKKAPEKKCDGKCHLKKMVDTEVALEKDNKSEAPQYPQLPNCNDLKESPLYLSDLSVALVPLLKSKVYLPDFISLNIQKHSPLKGRIYVPSVFHPPLV